MSNQHYRKKVTTTTVELTERSIKELSLTICSEVSSSTLHQDHHHESLVDEERSIQELSLEISSEVSYKT